MPKFIHYRVIYIPKSSEEAYVIYAENEEKAEEIFIEAYIKDFSTKNPGDKEKEEARKSIKSIEELVID